MVGGEGIAEASSSVPVWALVAISQSCSWGEGMIQTDQIVWGGGSGDIAWWGWRGGDTCGVVGGHAVGMWLERRWLGGCCRHSIELLEVIQFLARVGVGSAPTKLTCPSRPLTLLSH